VSGQHPPVKVRDVEAVLKHLGFTRRPQDGTSHVHWVKDAGGRRLKVTVDANNAPFKDKALKWMLVQMEVSKRDFYRILAKL
jgi:predicted RNA binding protein YcfA (HicA-like mRNA interferase family)